MSNLSQFFGGGGGGGIPAEVLVVNGGDGAWRASVVSVNPYAPATRCEVAQGRGGQVSNGFFSIAPGTTCPVTVGAGGLSDCRGPLGTPTPWCFYQCCVGGAGGASKFGNFGGEPRPTATCAGIALPYGIDVLEAYGCPFSTSLMSQQVTFCDPYVAKSFINYCALPPGTFPSMNCSTVSQTAFCGGGHLAYAGGITGTTSLCTGGFTSLAYHGFVSKITGTVQTYGASKAHGRYYCNGSFSSCACFSMCKSRPNPDALGTGSGHGAWRCDTSTIEACPGSVIVQYPSDFDAATTSSPSVCDCSPATPGFRTYRFLCPGTITFP